MFLLVSCRYICVPQRDANMAMFESTEKQREQLRVLVHFSQKGIFLYRLS